MKAGPVLLAALLAMAPLPAFAQQPLPNLYDVTVVATWDTLNVRAAPDGKAPIVGKLASTAKGIELLDRDASGKWGLVNIGEGSGWVALRFLKPQTPVWKSDALPLSLQCTGTEPFWSLKTVEKGVVLGEPERDDRRLSLRKVMDRGIAGDPMRGIIAGDDTGRLTAVVQPMQCSDGMSDRAYGLAVTVILDGQDMPSRMLTGCCSIGR
ncbi:peptide-binding protein [Paracoccus halophilus]|nr:peptide-binding protein [Paracoccus halophilus]